MEELNIVSGVSYFENNKIILEFCIFETGTIRQVHARNFGASSIRAVRGAIKFLKNKGVVYSGCEETDIKMIKGMKISGFKEVAREKNIVIMRGEF